MRSNLARPFLLILNQKRRLISVGIGGFSIVVVNDSSFLSYGAQRQRASSLILRAYFSLIARREGVEVKALAGCCLGIIIPRL